MILRRTGVRDFIELLNIIYQNPETDILALLSSGDFEFSKSGGDDEGQFAEFEI